MAEVYYDMFGEEIQRGRLICYASQNTMKAGIINNIKKSSTTYADFIKIQLMTIANYRGYERVETNPGVFVHRNKDSKRIMLYHIKLRVSEIENRVIVLNNPTYYIDNDRIKRQMNVVDLAKEQGYLPSDYEIGSALPPLEEETEIK